MSQVPAEITPTRRLRLASGARWKKYSFYYLMLAPALIGFFVFDYIPMYGVIMAFKDFRFIEGIIGSPWVGFEHFRSLFEDIFFWRIFRNTLVISCLHILFGFPAPNLPSAHLARCCGR